MKLYLIKDKLILIQFEEAKNFNSKRLTWVPTLNEIALITEAVKTINARNEQMKSVVMTWKVARLLKVSKRVAQRYMRSLVKAGFCQRRRQGSRMIYDFVDPERTIIIALKFKPFRKYIRNFAKEDDT